VLPRVRAGELSVTQAAAALGTSRATVYRLLAADRPGQDAASGAWTGPGRAEDRQAQPNAVPITQPRSKAGFFASC